MAQRYKGLALEVVSPPSQEVNKQTLDASTLPRDPLIVSFSLFLDKCMLPSLSYPCGSQSCREILSQFNTLLLLVLTKTGNVEGLLSPTLQMRDMSLLIAQGQ